MANLLFVGQVDNLKASMPWAGVMETAQEACWEFRPQNWDDRKKV